MINKMYRIKIVLMKQMIIMIQPKIKIHNFRIILFLQKVKNKQEINKIKNL